MVIDNFLDVLMAGDEGVARYRARDFGASEQLVAEHGFSAVVAFERNGDRHAVLYDAGLTPHAWRATSTCSRWRWATCARSSSRMAMLTTTAVSRDSPVGSGRSRLPLVIHPDAWRERRVVVSNGRRAAPATAEPPRP